VSEAHTEWRLKPMQAGGQRVLSFALVIEPSGAVQEYTDRYGNGVYHFDVLASHQRQRVSAHSEVVTAESFVDDARSLSLLEEYDYLMPSRYVSCDDAIVQFSAGPAAEGATQARALALMAAVHAALTYVPGVTDVHTTAGEVLALGRGVCQDFAHLLLAACRCQGLPARYVSGYLYSPGAGNGSAASHAWVDVFVGGQGWLALDPTHNCAQTDQYVRVAVGRDYDDVPPTRGVYKGTASEQLAVEVHVQAL
jgi:transglutaminase-like putative cysteine protease